MALTIQMGKSENGLFVTNEHAADRHAAKKETSGRKSTIYAGDLAVRPDSIQLKREQARKQAMKVLDDVFAADKEISQSMTDMTDRVKALQEENVANYKELERIDKARAELMESGEPEDSEALQESMKGLDEEEQEIRKRIAENAASVKGIHSSLRDTKLELLKSDPMVEAQGQAEDIMAAANKEIVGMMWDEARKHVEEKMAEEKEKAEKIAEKKEEEEEKIEAKKEKEQQMEEWIENTKDAAEPSQPSHVELPGSKDLEQLASYNSEKQEIDREIEEILDELKLIQEDLKGAAVDTSL